MKISRIVPLALVASLGVMQAQERPNLLVIHTDEQTFRSLGCYRALMDNSQALPWGEDAVVETPNLDRLATEGAICTRYYASCPVSTPSRASLQTGLYPISTGAPINDMAMDPNLTTYAQKLKEAGYNTSYVGKWHLSGVPNINRPYFEPGYNFGYMDRRYMYDNGHWKWFEIVGELNQVVGHYKVPAGKEVVYSTDYLTDRALEVLEKDSQGEAPFYMMISIPDPHSPDIGKEPYLSEYLEKEYSSPETFVTKLSDERPVWGRGGFDVRDKGFNAAAVANYFASVKCIDDNVGRIFDYLEDHGLMDNTIIIFSSDHGDMLYEHSRINKGVPYEAAARIPFMIRYPKLIEAGKVISTPYTTVDFAPTILGLMNVEQIEGVEGENYAEDFTSKETIVHSDRIVYITASPRPEWTMATDGRYKLILSCKDHPWLIDLERDPNEQINFYSDPLYSEIANRLQAELNRQMELYNDPALSYDYPFVQSSDAQINYNRKPIEGYKAEALGAMIMDIEQTCIRPLK
ncbi:MAG: sulfatase-like hydrolase/transferase [Rikenellaceae bacterium]